MQVINDINDTDAGPSDLPHSADPQEIDDLEEFLNQVIPPAETAEVKGESSA